MGSSLRSSSNRCSPAPGAVFDPFLIGEGHQEHQTSTSIIRLEDSGRVFCPLCLEHRSSCDITNIERKTFDQYVQNLFEALDQHGEKLQLRRIVLPMLEIILSKRCLVIERDNDFHDLLRIIYKVMKSDKFNINEFASLSSILGGLEIKSVRPLPLKSAWEAWQELMVYGEKKLLSVDELHPATATKFLCGLAKIVKTYLGTINSTALDLVSDLVFPLYINDTSESLCRKYYIESQIECMKFMVGKLIAHCSYYFTQYKLDDQGLKLISEIFGGLNECLTASIRLNYEYFKDWLFQFDPISKIHSIFKQNKSKNYRINVETFLKNYVKFHIEKNYGSDELLRDYTCADIRPETYASRAASFIRDDSRFKSTIFYILTNCVAIKHNSSYFHPGRVRSVIAVDNADLTRLRSKLYESKLITRVFAFVFASILPHGFGFAHQAPLIKLISDIINEIHAQFGNLAFQEVFCYEEEVFSWSCKRPEFSGLINRDAIDFVFRNSYKGGQLDYCLASVLKQKALKGSFFSVLKKDKGVIVDELLKINKSRPIDDLVRQLSGILPGLLSEALLISLTSEQEDRRCVGLDRIICVVTSLNGLILRYTKFDLLLDDQLITDISKFLKSLYRSQKLNDLEKQTLVALHSFIRCLLDSNDLSIMKLYKHLKNSLLGYMINLIINFETLDAVAESAAGVLVSLDNLDYPLSIRIDHHVLPLNNFNIVEWMLYGSHDLQTLSLKVVGAFFQDVHRPRGKTSARLATGLVHMLYMNQNLLEDSLRILEKIFQSEELKYHPMCATLLESCPGVDKLLETYTNNQDDGSSNAHDLSFDSSDTGIFDEEKISISGILDQLHEDEVFRDNRTSQIPRNIFLYNSIDNPQSNSASTQEWERRAYHTSQSTHSGNTQSCNTQPGESQFGTQRSRDTQ